MFIDGAKQPVCRPQVTGTCDRLSSNLQEAVYSGHKRQHCMNYQGAVAPDGLMLHFWGPFDGRCHDSTVLAESKVLEVFESTPELQHHYVYGDPAYGCAPNLMCGYKGSNLTPVSGFHYIYRITITLNSACSESEGVQSEDVLIERVCGMGIRKN